MVALSFICCLLLFVVVGISSSYQKKLSTKDYLLAGRDTKPWMVGFASVATNNSGYMFIGLLGFAYLTGISAMWLMIGGIAGDFMASLFIHRKLRKISGEHESFSFSSTISNWQGQDFSKLKLISGLITIIFLGAYASAQFSAGSKALHVVFGWDYSIGAIICAAVVIIYCFSGGVRASIWANTAQSFIMITSIAYLFFVALDKIGGWSSFTEAAINISPDYASIFPAEFNGNILKIILFLSGWTIGGIGVVGQPHIMLAFMTMEKPSDIKQVRFFYYTWFIIFSALIILTGIAARILLPEMQNFDPELAMPTLSQNLLSPIAVGFLLAGIFSAAMSTADSQILCCTAAITNDLKKNKLGYFATKMATIFITAIALAFALYGSNSVFHIALIAWSALAGAFAPLLILLVCKCNMNENEMIFISITGMLTALIWFYFGLSSLMYETAPAIIAGLAAYGLVRIYKLAKNPQK